MALRLGVAVLATVVAAVALLPAPAAAGGTDLDALVVAASSASGRRRLMASCDGAIGECDVDDEEDVEELALLGAGASAGEAMRRSLAARRPTNRYVSYAALDANKVPCNKRGQSYYQNCASQKPANPYRRGCSAITRCARTMN
ncbi:protein RALF-like 19 [Oryza brachyantha]|uniref:protein RALF-like 19 n=1 Tax=Oryza brachyantha TaxID=4533 RepID=UPI001ADB2880|nr:protein RALF-like 19 [Oryza brachyantha]